MHRDFRDTLLTAMPIERAKTLRGMLSWSPRFRRGTHHDRDADGRSGSRRPSAGCRTRSAIESPISGCDGHAGRYVYVTDDEQQSARRVPFRSLVLAQADRVGHRSGGGRRRHRRPAHRRRGSRAAVHQPSRSRNSPVVDGDRRLLGILTEDQAFDIIAGGEHRGRRKARRLSTIGGAVSARLAVAAVAQADRLAAGAVRRRGLHRHRAARLRGRDGGGGRARLLHPAADRHRRQHRHPDHHDAGARDGHRSGPVARPARRRGQGDVDGHADRRSRWRPPR